MIVIGNSTVMKGYSDHWRTIVEAITEKKGELAWHTPNTDPDTAEGKPHAVLEAGGGGSEEREQDHSQGEITEATWKLHRVRKEANRSGGQ